MTQSQNILQQIQQLYTMNASQLRHMWQQLYTTPPPAFNKPYYIKKLAYRLQEQHYNSNTARLHKRLQLLSQHKQVITHQPIAGTILSRLWHGVVHQVTVLDKGFNYNGQYYKSLSGIARHITGSSWNGLVFFGIKQRTHTNEPCTV